MASAPRPGRKGGKIDSPAIAPSTAARTPPSEVKLARDPSEQLPAEQPAVTASSSSGFSFDSAFLKFDPTAVDLVGKGSVMGGAKHVRMEQRSAAGEKAEIEAKLQLFFSDCAGEYRKPHPRDTVDALTAALKENNSVATTLEEGMLLASTITSSEGALVLVVAPSYFVVEKTAEQLRNALPSASQVATFVGSSFSAGATPQVRLWVTDAKTALGIFVQTTQPNPVTHLLFFKSHVHQPSVQLVLAGAKQSAAFQTSGKILFAGGTIVNDCAKLAQYLTPLTLGCSPSLTAAPQHEVKTFDLEETCALLGKHVLSVAVDRTGRYPGPHPKLVENSLEICLALLEKVARSAKSPQTIVVFTADVGDAIAHLQKNDTLSKYLITRDELATNTINPASNAVDTHRIFVFGHCDVDECLLLHPTIVIDKGTMKSTWVPSQAEVAFPAKRTEWESVDEQALRHRMLGWGSVGAYFSLYPAEAKDVFFKSTPMHLDQVDMENAMLQVSRAKAVVSPESILTTFPKETIFRSMVELSETAAIVSAENIGFTFTGEVLHRLPMVPELSNIVLQGLILGLEEAAIAAAAVATIHLYPHKPETDNSTFEKWCEHVAAVRKDASAGKSSTSDVLADAAVVLKWLAGSLRAPDQAEALANAVGVPLYRLQCIVALMKHLREQLTDYAFLDSFSVVADVDRTLASLLQQWDVLMIVVATSLCRKSVVVRNDGQINVRDVSGNMMFLRTAKSAAPNNYVPSSVPWKVGNVVVGAAVQNTAHSLFVKDVTSLRAPFYLTTLILLSPAMEYSAPQTTNTDSTPVVYLSMAANGQQKRAKVGIEGAARMLEFREKWNRVYGCIMVLRSLPRGTSVAQFTQYLQSRDKSLHLKAMQKELQEELKAIAEEAQVTEDNRSFPQTTCHRFAPSTELMDASLAVSMPSDEEAIAAFCKRSVVMAPAGASSSSVTAPATAAAAPISAGDVEHVHGGQANPIFVEDDDVETAESYFAQHGPLIDEDDE